MTSMTSPQAVNLEALKTICGGVYHSMITYNEVEINERFYEQICSYLHLPLSSIYCLDEIGYGFRLSFRSFCMTYKHSDFHEKREIVISGEFKVKNRHVTR